MHFKRSWFQMKAMNVFYMHRNKKLNFVVLIKFLNIVLQDFDIFISLVLNSWYENISIENLRLL